MMSEADRLRGDAAACRIFAGRYRHQARRPLVATDDRAGAPPEPGEWTGVNDLFGRRRRAAADSSKDKP